MSLDQQMGEHAPPTQRRRLTLARKALIGVMAIGAFAATSGAGTFASFTASTDNAGGGIGDGANPFQTPDFELTNDVLARQGSAVALGECASSDDTQEFPEATNEPDAANLPFVNLGGAAYCDALFTVGTVFEFDQTADLRLENTGNEDGNLWFYAVDLKADDETSDAATTMPCIVDPDLRTDPNFHNGTTKIHKSLCGDWELQIQEYSHTGGPLSGADTDDPFTTARGACLFPWKTAAVCGADDAAFNTLPLFSTTPRDIGSLPAVTTKTLANDKADSRFFRVTAKLTPDAGCDDDGAPAGVADDGFDDATGVGCYNSKMNGSAVIQLRWVLQES